MNKSDFSKYSKSTKLRINKLIKCESCHNIFDHWDASGNKCSICGCTFTSAKGKKIMNNLVELGYYDVKVYKNGNKKITEYHQIKEVKQIASSYNL